MHYELDYAGGSTTGLMERAPADVTVGTPEVARWTGPTVGLLPAAFGAVRFRTWLDLDPSSAHCALQHWDRGAFPFTQVRHGSTGTTYSASCAPPEPGEVCGKGIVLLNGASLAATIADETTWDVN